MDKEYKKLSRKYGFWMGMALFLMGLLLGFLLSPAKKGMRINNIGSIHGDEATRETMKAIKGAEDISLEEMQTCEDEDEYPDEEEKLSF